MASAECIGSHTCFQPPVGFPSKLAEARSRTKTRPTRILYLAKGAFDVRLRPRVIGQKGMSVFPSNDPPFSYDFADRRVPLDVHHHGPVIVRVVNQARLGDSTSDAPQALTYESARLLVRLVSHSKVPPRRC